MAGQEICILLKNVLLNNPDKNASFCLHYFGELIELFGIKELIALFKCIGIIDLTEEETDAFYEENNDSVLKDIINRYYAFVQSKKKETTLNRRRPQNE